MESVLFGELNCLRIPYSRTLRSLVERKVSEWVRGHFDGGYPRGIHYEVTLEKAHWDQGCLCRVRVCGRRQDWLAEEWDLAPEEALKSALARMQEIPHHSPESGNFVQAQQVLTGRAALSA